MIGELGRAARSEYSAPAMDPAGTDATQYLWMTRQGCSCGECNPIRCRRVPADRLENFCGFQNVVGTRPVACVEPSVYGTQNFVTIWSIDVMSATARSGRPIAALPRSASGSRLACEGGAVIRSENSGITKAAAAVRLETSDSYL